MAVWPRLFDGDLKWMIESDPSYVEEFVVHWAKRGPLARDPLVHGDGPQGIHLSFSILPCTLFPSPFPRDLFNHGRLLCDDFAKFFMAVSSDIQWLLKTLSPICGIDEWICHLCGIANAAYSVKRVDECLHGFMSRVDFMAELVDGKPVLRLVELNPISVAGILMTSNLVDVHKCNLRRLKRDGKFNNRETEGIAVCGHPNEMFDSVIRMHKTYCEHFELKDATVVVVTGGKHEVNYEEVHEVVVRCREQDVGVILITSDELADLARSHRLRTVDEGRPGAGSTLKVCLQRFDSEEREVSVVYFRCQYTPKEFSTESHYSARLLIEKSRCFSIPTIPDILAGMKKVQQVWSNPTCVESFVRDGYDFSPERIRNTFVGFVDPCEYFTDANTRMEVDAAIENPTNFILKPCREGGSNNIEGQDIVRVLKETIQTRPTATIHVLMRRIKTPPVESVLLRRNPESPFSHVSVECQQVISEVGYYSSSIWLGNRLISSASPDSTYWGYLVRTKPVTVSEGGVVIGASSIDSFYLID